jgi:hypothetical protein
MADAVCWFGTIGLLPCQVISAAHSLTIPSDLLCDECRLNGSIGSNERCQHDKDTTNRMDRNAVSILRRTGDNPVPNLRPHRV